MESLLSWERGLKFIQIIFNIQLTQSLLSWERGLKSLSSSGNYSGRLSLLSWERGLKYVIMFIFLFSFCVAPLVGAWIEIMDLCRSVSALLSLLSWERGLKYAKTMYA